MRINIRTETLQVTQSAGQGSVNWAREELWIICIHEASPIDDPVSRKIVLTTQLATESCDGKEHTQWLGQELIVQLVQFPDFAVSKSECSDRELQRHEKPFSGAREEFRSIPKNRVLDDRVNNPIQEILEHDPLIML